MRQCGCGGEFFVVLYVYYGKGDNCSCIYCRRVFHYACGVSWKVRWCSCILRDLLSHCDECTGMKHGVAYNVQYITLATETQSFRTRAGDSR